MDRIMHRIISGYAWWTTSKDTEPQDYRAFWNNRKARPKYNLPSCNEGPLYPCIVIVYYYTKATTIERLTK